MASSGGTLVGAWGRCGAFPQRCTLDFKGEPGFALESGTIEGVLFRRRFLAAWKVVPSPGDFSSVKLCPSPGDFSCALSRESGFKF
jgi:hypothetical protein